MNAVTTEAEIKRLNRLSFNSKGGHEGYKFQNDSLANQMAYLFSGEDGKKRHKEY